MNASSVDIMRMLEDYSDSALGLSFGIDLFIGREPTKPDNCVTIFDTPGGPPQLTLDEDNDDYYYPSIQIRVRNRDYRAGWALIENIRTVLHGKANETWDTTTLYTVIYCSSGPALLDWDESDRARFIINFNLQRR